MYFLALRPVLGGFITPAGCTKLKVKLSIFYALAIASFLLKVYRSLTMCFSRARTCGNAIVSVSNPGSGLIRGPSITLLDLLLGAPCRYLTPPSLNPGSAPGTFTRTLVPFIFHVVVLLLFLHLELTQLNNRSTDRHETWCLDRIPLKLGTQPQILL